jgi:arsenate reductase (glutaredoxin)
MKIYYNPKCSKCRIAKEFLIKNNIEFDIFEYLNKKLTKKDIKEILTLGNFNIHEILRKNEPEYSLYIKKNLSDKQIINIIIKYPKLLQRPIIIKNDKAFIARNEESLNKVK